jgi:RHS repeat-associated protein
VDPASTKNAGHVYGITNNLDTTRSQNFTYDQLNRISSAQTTSTHATSAAHCWGEVYNVDTWGNLLSIAATANSAYVGCIEESGFTKTADVDNRVSGLSYDLSGNTIGDGTYAYIWDGESQLKSAGGVNYLYDGNGRRVAKVGSKLYWYGLGGEILAETNVAGALTAEYIYFGGQRVSMIPVGSTPYYYVEDLLGSSRVVTTSAGITCYDSDFYPYGGERAYTNTCSQNYKFEGKERDTETGNDDFGARYYSNRFGRWLSSDWSASPVPVPYANLLNPQTLNLYAMVSDDPETFADLDGHAQTADSWKGNLSFMLGTYWCTSECQGYRDKNGAPGSNPGEKSNPEAKSKPIAFTVIVIAIGGEANPGKPVAIKPDTVFLLEVTYAPGMTSGTKVALSMVVTDTQGKRIPGSEVVFSIDSTRESGSVKIDPKDNKDVLGGGFQLRGIVLSDRNFKSQLGNLALTFTNNQMSAASTAKIPAQFGGNASTIDLKSAQRVYGQGNGPSERDFMIP